MSSAVQFRIEVKTASEANRSRHEHWASRRKRVQRQRVATRLAWIAAGKPKLAVPATVTLTRSSVKVMDSDNLVGSIKACRDELAAIAGVDDGDPRLTFKYAQEKLPVRKQWIDVLWEAA